MHQLKTVTCLLFLLSVGAALQAQKFAEVGSSWTYQISNNVAPDVEEGILYVAERDTIVAGGSGTLVSRYSKYGRGPWLKEADELVSSSESGDSVYVYIQDSFRLIFDFTAQAGDTIVVMTEPFVGLFSEPDVRPLNQRFVYVIDSVDHVAYNGDTLLTQFVSYLNTPVDTIPEWGFGDVLDLANNTPGRIVQGVGALGRAAVLGISSDISYLTAVPDELNCYQDKNKQYSFGDADCLSLPTLISSTEDPEILTTKRATLFPNPFSAYLTVESDGYSVQSLRIMDSYGRTVREVNADRINTVNVQELPSGIYFVLLGFNDGKAEVHRTLRN